MSWFSRLNPWAQEQRATLNEVDFWLRDGWTNESASGIAVTPQAAFAVPEVYACITVLSQDAGRCPLKLRVQRDDGEWSDAINHPLWEILHDLPNPEMTAAEFRATMTRSLLQHEAAYAEIVRGPDGRVKSLWPLDSSRMTVSRDELNVKRYRYRVDDHGKIIDWTFNPDRPPILELRHPSPIHQCRDMIGLAIALDTYASKFFANGARLSGLLMSKSHMNEAQRKNAREVFEAMHRGVKNAHKIGVIEGDAEFKQLTAQNDEAQFNETRKLIRTMIAGTFRVPSHKVNDLERATFSNIEAQDRDYVNSGLDPYLVLWEQSVRRDVLTTRQYPRYQAIFDREALIGADMTSRMAALATGRQNGIWSVNDILRKLNENPISAAEGGDLHHMNGSMIPLTGAPVAPAEPAPDLEDDEDDEDDAPEPEQVM